MVLFWFLLALVLLIAAIVLMRLDAKQRRGGGARAPQAAVGEGQSLPTVDGSDDYPAEGGAGAGFDAERDVATDDAEESPDVDATDHVGDVDDVGSDDDNHGDDDEATLSSAPAGTHNEPMLAPFQRAAGPNAGPNAGANAGAKPERISTERSEGAADATAIADDEALAAASQAGLVPEVSESASESATESEREPEFDSETETETEPEADPAEAAALVSQSEASPRLLDRVLALLPARRSKPQPMDPVETEPVDPLAGSPVVRWLEDREFAPTPTPAPEFRHGDFAGGLSALGTVSHGVFRGRRAIMGVTGGRTVLALHRDTASDVVLDLSRADVETEPGFHDAGDVGSLEVRTSDVGRIELVDRERLTESMKDVPAGVRRIWAEGEWVAATIDGVDDPTSWDDVVMALHAAADVLAPLPPIGGRARALPAEMDPGAPAAAEGPEADPTMGMDGEVGTGTHGVAPLPDPEDFVVVDAPSAPDTKAGPDTSASPAPSGDTSVVEAATPSTALTSKFPAVLDASSATDGSVDQAQPAEPKQPQPRRSGGHLRLVPDRPAARDLTDAPVTADRGDATSASEDAGASTDAEPKGSGTETAPAAPAAPAESEPDPFAAIMEPSEPIEPRGDVAADHLEPRPPLSRPSRGVGQSFPEDATVPPLAVGAATGAAGIKPLGSEDNADEIRDEVERFDAARIDGGSDLDEGTAGRHGAPRRAAGRHGADDDVDPSEVTQRLSVAELAARMGVDPAEMRAAGGRRRRAKDDDQAEAEAEAAAEKGRERPGVEPDVERTTRIVLPPDIKE